MTSKVVYKGNLRTEAQHIASKSLIYTDAPIDNNGKGQLFSPTDLVATALASCMITVMGIKAEQSNIPFVNVEAEILKVMAADPRRIEEIKISFLIHEPWDAKQRKIMERTAETCPVAYSLHADLIAM
jgi:putative redox protein